MHNNKLNTCTDEALIAEVFRRFMPADGTSVYNLQLLGAFLRCSTTMLEVQRDPSKMVVVPEQRKANTAG